MDLNNYSVYEGCKNMLNIFRHKDLQTLLGAFGQSKTGRKSELKCRAIALLRTRPANIDYLAYIEKINEIHNSLQNEIIIINSSGSMRRNIPLNQQRQRQMLSSAGQIQIGPPQRMNQPDQLQQYPQQPMHMAGLPHVMIKMQGGMYDNHNTSNSIPDNKMFNHNIQYITAGNYKPSGTSTIVSHQLPTNQKMNIVSQDALGLGTTASGNTSYIPSIETVAQIKFKKLPFYEVIDEVIKPTLLTGTLLNDPRDTKEATFNHTLSLEQANYVCMNRDFSHGKKEYRNQFQIRICQLTEPVPNESPDYMPLGIEIRVNMKTCPLPPMPPNTRPNQMNETRRTSRPINCTAHVKLSPIVGNNITINWTPDEKHYVFAMYVVKKLSAKTLIKQIQNKGGRNSEFTRNYIIQKLADVDPDLAATSYRVPLICPLSKIRMKIPAKSIHCDHLQCFDAGTFIIMNEKKPSWTCPICNKPCLYEDILIENYFLEVVWSPTLKECNKEIEVLADGSWRIYEETIETINTNSGEVIPIESVDLDSDDEKCVDPKTELSLEISRTQEPKNNQKSSVVDLTLSGDEEPPTEKDKQENEAQAADAIYVVNLIPQAQVQPQQTVTSSEEGLVIEIDSPSPPSSPTLI